MKQHLPFWADLAGKLGPPMLGGTIVGCTLAGKIEVAHWVLLAVAVGLVYVGHRVQFHR
ncbi:MAG: hypothetical protein AAGD14_03030 [Planctomycetota bacterium]